MTHALLLGFVVLAVVVYLRSSVIVALIGMLVVTFAVPGTVQVVQAHSVYATFHRLVLLLFCFNILLKIVGRKLPASILRPSRLSGLLFGWVVVTFVIGVAFADSRIPIASSTFLWSIAVEQLIFVLFVVAAFRAIGDTRKIAWIIAGVALATAGVAVTEHFTRRGLGPYLTGILTGHPNLSSFQNLETRGDEVRVAAGLDFSLALAWVGTMLLPVVVVAASRARRFIVRVSPLLLVLAIVWTYARSAYLGIPLIAVVLLFASRFDPKLVRIFFAGAIVAAAVFFLTPTAKNAFSAEGTEGSTVIRKERLPVILSSAAQRPLIGRGLSSLSFSGLQTTDATYLLTYGETGVIGAAALGLLFMGTIALLLPGLRAPPNERVFAAASVAGVVAGLAGADFLDEFSISGSFRAFWLVACLGMVIAERIEVAPAPHAVARRVRRRFAPALVLSLAGAGAGIVLSSLTPVTPTAEARFTTRSPATEALVPNPAPLIGQADVETACSIIEARVLADTGDDIECYDDLTDVGVGDFRITAPTADRLARRLRTVTVAVRRFLPGFRVFRLAGSPVSKPTIARTAPYWLAFVGFGLGIFGGSSRPLRERLRIEGFYGDKLWPRLEV
jgi:O-antigen ligase/polysaccharide polymerase Wzy-like membrane protein